MTDDDEVYLRLKGARERLCVAQQRLASYPVHVHALSRCIETIDQVGAFHCPQYDQPTTALDPPPASTDVGPAHVVVKVFPIYGDRKNHYPEGTIYQVDIIQGVGAISRTWMGVDIGWHWRRSYTRPRTGAHLVRSVRAAQRIADRVNAEQGRESVAPAYRDAHDRTIVRPVGAP